MKEQHDGYQEEFANVKILTRLRYLIET